MPPLVLSEEEVLERQALASSGTLSYSILQRAQIVLAFGARETNTLSPNGRVSRASPSARSAIPAESLA